MLGHLLYVAQLVAKQEGLDKSGFRIVINDGADGCKHPLVLPPVMCIPVFSALRLQDHATGPSRICPSLCYDTRIEERSDHSKSSTPLFWFVASLSLLWHRAFNSL